MIWQFIACQYTSRITAIARGSPRCAIVGIAFSPAKHRCPMVAGLNRRLFVYGSGADAVLAARRGYDRSTNLAFCLAEALFPYTTDQTEFAFDRAESQSMSSGNLFVGKSLHLIESNLLKDLVFQLVKKTLALFSDLGCEQGRWFRARDIRKD